MSGNPITVAGVDLAWGERRADAICFAELSGRRACVTGHAWPRGDAALVAALTGGLPAGSRALVAIDGPLVCPNPTGARPVDREISRRFWREHAGCHPANTRLCPRPPRIARALVGEGFAIGHDPRAARRLVMEVYPHPAMVRLLRLARIVKYKRGPARARRAEFARLQALLRELLSAAFAFLALGEQTRALLAAPWSQRAEDGTDALFCALVALWHARHGGRRSEVVGALDTGFVVLPEDLRQPELEAAAPAGAGATPPRGRRTAHRRSDGPRR